MLEPAFRRFLKKEYGFKENHVAILDYMYGNVEKKYTAEELWGKTPVPKGRIYGFLNDLVDWGFLIVDYKKPRQYQLREPMDAMYHALERKEEHFFELENKTRDFAQKLQVMWHRHEPGAHLRIEVLRTRDEWYMKIREIALESRELRIMGRTPILLLPSERKTSTWRRRAYEAIVKKINKGFLVKLVFAKEDTLEALRGETDKKAVLEGFEFVRSMPNLFVRYAPEARITSMFVSEQEVVIGFHSPEERKVARAVAFKSKELAEVYRQLYELLFSESKTINDELVKKAVKVTGTKAA